MTPRGRQALNAPSGAWLESEAWARAWSAVTRRVAVLPSAEARQYLETVRALYATARPEA